MYQYTFDEDTTKKIREQTENSSNIFKQFENVDSKYNSLNESGANLSLEKIEYTPPTQEEVINKAQNSLESYKNSSINKINETYDEKVNNIDESIESAKVTAENDKNQIYSAYQNAKENAKDDAIKRGLARSSIIVNTLAGYDNSMINELSEKTNKLNDSIKEYENQRNLLEEQKMGALGSFDIEYAVKLQEKIDEINTQIQEKEQESIEYNNKISQIESEWKKAQEDGNFDKTVELAKLIDEDGSAVIDVLKQYEKYNLAKSYFAGLSKEQALEELKNNSAFLANVGRYNYNKLLEELEARE